MEIDKKTKEKINDLQLMEQKLQHFLMQKQTIQVQSMEIDNALTELKKGDGNVYKIVGNVMLESNRKDLTKELEEKKQVLDLRMKNLEKQEQKIKKQATELQQEIIKAMNKE